MNETVGAYRDISKETKKVQSSVGSYKQAQHAHQLFAQGVDLGRFDVFFRNQLLVFQQHQDESLYDSWTRFKDIIRKVPNHGLSIWTLIEIFLKHLDSLSRHIINLTAEGDLRKFSDIGAWVQVPRCMAWLDYDEHVDSLGEELRPNEVEKGRILEAHRLLAYSSTTNFSMYGSFSSRSLEVLRKFHWMILGGRFNQLSHVSSPLLSKPGEY
ncbi:hypothetical protein Tco_0217271 [Tanacetum coccineum]